MKNVSLLWVLFAPLLFALPSCNAPDAAGHHHHEVNLDSVRTQIEAMEAAYAVASNAKDVDGVAAYYASDAHSLADNEPTRVGIDAIKAGIKKEFEMDTTGMTISFKTTDVWADGKYAVETGTSTVTDKDGKVAHTGKYMTLFELRDGKYIAIRDMWNADAKRE